MSLWCSNLRTQVLPSAILQPRNTLITIKLRSNGGMDGGLDGGLDGDLGFRAHPPYHGLAEAFADGTLPLAR